MVTANLNHERRSSPGVNEDNDDNHRSRYIQTHLDRLYLDNSQYSHPYRQYSQRTLSPTNSRDMHISSNSIPVYRHGRKFYVTSEEFERMRAEERLQRRTAMQRSQNLPVHRVHAANFRSTSASLHHPIHRSSSHSHDRRHGLTKLLHMPTTSPADNTGSNNNLRESTRTSRSTFRYFDEHDEPPSISIALPLKSSSKSTHTNTSDDVLHFERVPKPSVSSSYGDYSSNDNELKRSFSAELVPPSEEQLYQPKVVPRRIMPCASSDYGMSFGTSSYPMTSTDQSNATNSTSYFNQTVNSPRSLSTTDFTSSNSMYSNGMHESNQFYRILPSSNKYFEDNLVASALTLAPSSSSSNHNIHKCYPRETVSGSFSDDNSSSPTMLNKRRNLRVNRHRQPHPAVETDDDYPQHSEGWTRSTARSQSSDGLTEKKRVRFADMEGFTLETVSNIDERPSPADDHHSIMHSYIPSSTNKQRQGQSFHNTFYQPTRPVSYGGSKLATDV